MADQLSAQLLSHILDRVRIDLALLESVGCISSEDLEAIETRLPSSFTTPSTTVQNPVSAPMPPAITQSTPSFAARAHPPPPTRTTKRVEAKWDYETNVSSISRAPGMDRDLLTKLVASGPGGFDI